MPILKIKNESYMNADAISNLIQYIQRLGYSGGLAVDLENAAEQMQLVKELWYKTEGRQARHFIVSFSDNEPLEPSDALEYGYSIARYYSGRFQIVFNVHTNTDHIHLHFVMNTVSYLDGQKYSEGRGDYVKFRDYIQSLMPDGWIVQLVTDNSTEW